MFRSQLQFALLYFGVSIRELEESGNLIDADFFLCHQVRFVEMNQPIQKLSVRMNNIL
jgi:hypothetical protein